MDALDDLLGRQARGAAASPMSGDPLDALLSAQASAPEATPAPEKSKAERFSLKGDGYDQIMAYNPRDAIGGSVRGLGSLGATLLRPFESADANEGRRGAMDQGLTSAIGSDPNSLAYRTNKLITEMGGATGAAKLVAKGISMIPGAAAALPTLLPAIESAGMTANGAKGLYGAANRVAGGAVNGAVTAGSVDPKDTATGFMVGGATPPVVSTLGKVGSTVGGAFKTAPLNPNMQKTVADSVNAGYIIPPNMVQPNLKNQVIESFSGKQATQQIASTKNTEVTERLTREALGIAPDVPLSKATLEDLRKTAGRAYGEVSSLSPQAAADLEALKTARNDAQANFTYFNKSGKPAALAAAKEARALSDQLETALEQHAANAGRPELIPALRDARKQIAKTYTVERALNDATGTVDARVFGRLYDKGKPLSDGLDVAGRFASGFPSIAKSPQQVGSPASHNLKAVLSMGLAAGGGGGAAVAGLGGLATGGVGLLGAALPFVTPPIARSIMFRKGAQQALTGANAGGGLLSQSIEDMLPLMYRTGGLLATSGQ